MLHLRETAHGVKAVYDDGHLVEFAVFAADEIGRARLNRTRVLIDRADVTDRVAATVAGTPDRIPEDAESDESDEYLEGQLLTALLVGVQRHRRGEHLSGIDFVHRYALRHLLVLLARHVQTDRPEVKDDLNPFAGSSSPTRPSAQSWGGSSRPATSRGTHGDCSRSRRGSWPARSTPADPCGRSSAAPSRHHRSIDLSWHRIRPRVQDPPAGSGGHNRSIDLL